MTPERERELLIRSAAVAYAREELDRTEVVCRGIVQRPAEALVLLSVGAAGEELALHLRRGLTLEWVVVDELEAADYYRNLPH